MSTTDVRISHIYMDLNRGGTYLTKIYFLKFFRRFLMFIYVSKQDQKFFLGDLKIRVRVRPYYFVNYQNLSGEQ